MIQKIKKKIKEKIRAYKMWRFMRKHNKIEMVPHFDYFPYGTKFKRDRVGEIKYKIEKFFKKLLRIKKKDA